MSELPLKSKSGFTEEKEVLRQKLREMYSKEEGLFGQWEFFEVTDEGVSTLEPLQLISRLSLTDKHLENIYRFEKEYDKFDTLQLYLEKHSNNHDVVFVSVRLENNIEIITTEILENESECEDVEFLSIYTLMLKRVDISYLTEFKSKYNLSTIKEFLNLFSETNGFTIITCGERENELLDSSRFTKELILNELFSIINSKGDLIIYADNKSLADGPVLFAEFNNDIESYGKEQMILSYGFNKLIDTVGSVTLMDSAYGSHDELVSYLKELEKNHASNILLFDILDISSDGVPLELDYAKTQEVVEYATELLEELNNSFLIKKD